MSFSSKTYIYKLLVVLIVISTGYLYATPYLSLLYFKSALENKNSKEASKYIDFPSVRESIREQFESSFKDKIYKDNFRNSLNILGVNVIDPLVSKLSKSILENTITPSGLQNLITKGEFTKKQIIKTDSVQIKKNKNDKAKFKLFYAKPNKFVLSSYLNGIDQPVKTFWERNRFIHWKLTSLEIPSDVFKSLY